MFPLMPNMQDYQRYVLWCAQLRAVPVPTKIRPPCFCVQPDRVWYYALGSVKLDSIIRQHLMAGEPVAE